MPNQGVRWKTRLFHILGHLPKGDKNECDKTFLMCFFIFVVGIGSNFFMTWKYLFLFVCIFYHLYLVETLVWQIFTFVCELPISQMGPWGSSGCIIERKSFDLKPSQREDSFLDKQELWHIPVFQVVPLIWFSRMSCWTEFGLSWGLKLGVRCEWRGGAIL